MIRISILIAAGLVLLFAAPAARAQSDDQIKQEIIRDSLASYPGNCPCPYNLDRAGHHCGRRSAYSRPGGASPLCYPADVTTAMIAQYRAKSGANTSVGQDSQEPEPAHAP